MPTGFTEVTSALAAVFSAGCAALSYKLAQSIRSELKSDDRIIVGTVAQPELRESAHARCVLRCPLFNKSKRKAYVDGVAVFDRNSKPVNVMWSAEIDSLGMPQRPSGLVGITDSADLFIRRNDGKEFDYARILFSHSFSEVRVVVTFDPTDNFVQELVNGNSSSSGGS